MCGGTFKTRASSNKVSNALVTPPTSQVYMDGRDHLQSGHSLSGLVDLNIKYENRNGPRVMRGCRALGRSPGLTE